MTARKRPRRAARRKAGVCCSCGYAGAEETPCHSREDRTHCNHWWDGVPDEEVRHARR